MSGTDEAQPVDGLPRVWLLPTGIRSAIDRSCIATEGPPGVFIVQQPFDQLPDDAVLLAHDVVRSLVARRECLLPDAHKSDSTDAGRQPDVR